MTEPSDPSLEQTARKAAMYKRQSVLSSLNNPLPDVTNDLLDGRTHVCEHLHVVKKEEGKSIELLKVLDEGAFLIHLGHLGDEELYYWRSRQDERIWGYGFSHYEKSDEATRTFIVNGKSANELAFEYDVNVLISSIRLLDGTRTRILMDLPDE